MNEPISCECGHTTMSAEDAALHTTQVRRVIEQHPSLIPLTPEGASVFRECVEALRMCVDWILLGNHAEAPGWIEARDTALVALTHAQEPR